MKITRMWKQFWEDRFMNSSRRFSAYVNEWMTLHERDGWNSKKSKRILRKEKLELILQKVYLVFLYGGES